MNDPKDMFWDSCVFIRYLTQSPPELVDDIEDYIRDAARKQRRIYYSTVSLAEIKPKYLKQRGYGSAMDFFDDFKAAFIPVDPTPDILMAAGELRDETVTNPTDPKAEPRSIGTPDAILLMTALHLRDDRKVPGVVFHTFDKGKGVTWEGRCVPLLGFERWFPNPATGSHAERVCKLPRFEPIHPQMRLIGGARAQGS